MNTARPKTLECVAKRFQLIPIFEDSEPIFDRPCGLVVRVLGYKSGGQVSIPGTTRFSEK
jgi:hypothetical protein